MRRRSAGAPRRSSSAPPPASRSSARSTPRPRCWRGPMPRCMRARRREEKLPLPACGARESRNDIRSELVFDERDAVAQLQLALLQALHLNEVGARRFLQRRDRGIEVAMLLLQTRKLRPKLAFFLF